jgi:hypothetical protein
VLLALALYASTATAGVGGTPGVVGDNTPQYDLKLLYHDRRRMGRTSACPGQELRLPGSRVTASTEPPIGQPRLVRSACSASLARLVCPNTTRAAAVPANVSRKPKTLTTPFRRGPDLIPRDSVGLLLRSLRDDDGDLAKELLVSNGDSLPLRAAIARNLLQAANDPQHPQATLAILRELGDRLDGKSPPRTEQREVRQTIIYKAGGPPRGLQSERERVETGVLPGPATWFSTRSAAVDASEVRGADQRAGAGALDPPD